MTDPTTILVTAASGNVGRHLVPQLRASGASVRILRRDPGPLAEQFHGVDRLFLACGNVPAQVEFECAMIDHAVQAGVRRIVKLSARGADLDAPVAFWQWHALIEQHLRHASTPAVLLRPSFMMSNLFAATVPIREQGMLFAPAGTARISMIDPADVAAVAARALIEDGHDGRDYVLTGPEAVSYVGIAQAASAAVGRGVDYADIPPDAAVAAMTGAGVPAFAAQQIVAVFAELRRGVQSETTDAVRRVTGRDPRSVAGWFSAHAAAFVREPAPVS